mgnify:CR=1 FL=1
MEYETNDSVVLAKRVRKRKEKRSGKEGLDINSPSKRSRKKKAAMESSDEKNIKKMLKETQSCRKFYKRKFSNFCKNLAIEDINEK